MDNSMRKGKGWEGKKAGEAGPSVITREEGTGEPTRLAPPAGAGALAQQAAFPQVPVTLEDVAVYLSQEEWGCLDLAQQDHSCDVLLEDAGAVGRRCQTPRCVPEWASLWEGAASFRLAEGVCWSPGPEDPGHLPVQHFPWLPPPLGAAPAVLKL